VSIEALVLALTAVIRPTSAAAVVAMLSARHPQRLLVAYLLAGLTFSVAVGILVILLVHGLNPSPAGRPVIDVALGAIALGCAAAAWIGWLPRRRPDRPPDQQSWLWRRLRNLTPSGAATAGVVTHLPGLVYLAALNAIVNSAAGTLDGVFQVVVYNAIWFSLPIVALVLSLYRPIMFRDFLDAVALWAVRNQRVILIVFFGVLGTYIAASGVLGLLHPAT
jgi:hypothetical protein